jgi:hypothetical protein
MVDVPHTFPNLDSIHPPNPSCPERRGEFLIEVYRQTSTHLGRHVSGVWQCVGVVGAGFAVFSLGKDSVLNDFATALVILLNGWLAATTLDASNWFNRNLVIIANVERLFLSAQDLSSVHPFFASHRKPGRLADHFRIQLALSIGVSMLVLAYHFHGRVVPGFALPLSAFEVQRSLPYLVAILCGYLCWRLKAIFTGKDSQLQRKAPGITVEI